MKKEKREFSSWKKLENVLQVIKHDLLKICDTKKKSLNEIKRYYKEFKREPDYNIAQYGKLLISDYDIRKMYKKAGYRSSIDRMSVSKLWDTYLNQVGYVVRHIINNVK